MSYAEKLVITNPTVKYKPSKEDKIGGEGGIRTHVPLRATAFRVRLVMTTSICLRTAFIIYRTPPAGQVEILLFCPAAARTMLFAAATGPLYSIPWGLSIMRYQYPKYRECPLAPPVSLK